MYGNSDKETRSKIRAALAVGPVREFGPLQAIGGAREALDESFASSPIYEGEFGLDELPEGVGGVLPGLAVTALTRRWGISFTGVGVIDAAMAESVKSFHASLANGDSIEEAYDKHDLGMWLGGSVELLPIPRVLSKAGDKSIRNILLRAMESGGGAVGKDELVRRVSRALNDSPEVSHDPESDSFTAMLDGKDVTFSKKALEYVLAVMTGLE